MAKTIKLTIYIDQTLLEPDPDTGLPKLGNLTLARKVGGVTNAVFQSISTVNFSNTNYFAWQQSYKIGAYKGTPKDGAMIGARAATKRIGQNMMCDWTGSHGHPLQFMPDPEQADSGWFSKFPKEQGMFGTKGQPEEWLNAIWCSTGESGFTPIYTETTHPPPGLPYRGFQVSNDYQVSWESESRAPGIFAPTWSDPTAFSMGPADDAKFLSWGYDEAQQKVDWYDYGTKDPDGHDPTKGTPLATALGSRDFDIEGAPARRPLSIRFDWTDATLSAAARRSYAEQMFQYVTQSTKGYMNFRNVFLGSYLSTSVNLKPSTGFGDLVPGETEDEKLVFYLRSLISNIAPRYSPTLIDWTYNTALDDSANSIGSGSFIKFVWRHLPSATAITAAMASAQLFTDKLRENLKTTQFRFESVVQNPKDNTVAYTSVKFTNISPSEYASAFAALQKLAAHERARTNADTKHPDLPTPDDVELKGDDSILKVVDAERPETNGNHTLTDGVDSATSESPVAA